MIYGFYHVAVMRDFWKDVFQEQVTKIKSSGLYDVTEKIYLGIVGNKKVDFSEFNLDPKFEIMFQYEGSILSKGELPTIERLHSFCISHPNDKVWYIHTKGVSRPLGRNITAWRRYMEYFVIERHQDAIRVLDKYDCCGCDWYTAKEFWQTYRQAGKPIFCGNFWWANANFIAKLPPINIAYDSRMRAEEWLGEGRPNAFSLWKSLTCMYTFYYPRSRYAGKRLF